MKTWYSYFDRGDYKGNEPFFFDTSTISWVSYLEENAGTIKAELQNLLNNHEKFIPYFNKSSVDQQQAWKTVPFKWWGIEFYKQQKICPETTKILNAIPNLVSASFSMLDQQSTILPHCGDTNGIYRCHLGLIIPGQLPECGFQVGDEKKNWVEGKLLVFCDAHKHAAVNHTDSKRYILIIDVIRPEFVSKKRWICANVMGSLFLQKRFQKSRLSKYIPMWFQNFTHFIAKINAVWFIPFRNFLFKIFS